MNLKTIKHPCLAFSIIEVMIGIFIFSLGLVSIYALLVSSLQVNEYNKNAIIASNLAREQVEIFRNTRDTNYKMLKKWNQVNPYETYTASTELFTSWYFKLSNDFSASASFSTQLEPIASHNEWVANLSVMQDYRLCIDDDNVYSYDCSAASSRPTPFYRYLHIEPATDDASNTIPGAFQITSKVIWYKRWYHEFDIKTIVTDWRRI